MNDRFEVSAVIPTFNGSLFIEQTLESLFTQSTPPVEIVVVDDKSTDNTVEVVERVARNSPIPVRLIRLNENSGGPALPMNTGIDRAVGEVIAMLDQDDLMCRDRLRSSIVALKRYCQASFVFGDSFLFNDNGYIEGSRCAAVYDGIAELNFFGDPPMTFMDRDDWKKRFFMDSGVQRSCSNHFFRKSIWKEMGGYREKAKLCTDYDFVIRAFGPGVVWLKDNAFEKRVHFNNAWQGSMEQYFHLISVQQEIASLDPSKELLHIFEHLTQRAAQNWVRSRFAWSIACNRF